MSSPLDTQPPAEQSRDLTQEPADELINVARIVRPQGRNGEVIADLLTDFPERFARLDMVRIRLANGERLTLKLVRARPHKGRVILKFEGYDSIDQAEMLRHAHLVITREELIDLPENTFYEFDLIGCEVVTVAGKPVGRVTRVQNFGAAPLLSVVDQERREYMIPLALSICVGIDTKQKRIVVDPPEGLLEL